MLAVEVRHATLTTHHRKRRRRTTKEDEEEDEAEEKEEDEKTDIKSNNPHLTGGEKASFGLLENWGAPTSQKNDKAAKF